MKRRPACMTDDEWETWNAPVVTFYESPGFEKGGGWVREQEVVRRYRTTLRWQSPCVECPLAFHQEMKAEGRCDGVPLARNGRPILPADERTAARRAQWRAYNRRRRNAA